MDSRQRRGRAVRRGQRSAAGDAVPRRVDAGGGPGVRCSMPDEPDGETVARRSLGCGVPESRLEDTSMTRTGWIAAAAVLALAAPVGAAEKPAKPNILLIMADDMGFSDLGCYGS